MEARIIVDKDQFTPEIDLKTLLLNVSKPGRYTGGEFSARSLENDPALTFALSFPDMYEIGMSNHAVRILYGLLNSIGGVRCERVFAPAPDFAAELRHHNYPLYTLESGTYVNRFDFLGFSIGYELSFTNILSILDLSNIPLKRMERRETDPLIIGGGPSITNPLPFAEFFDGIYIGEIEGVVQNLFRDLTAIKSRGGGREELRERLIAEPSIWTYKKLEKGTVVKREVWPGFDAVSPPIDFFPVQNIKIVQDHAVVEIMRGCSNGCRFCHAGMIYRPVREKPCSLILREADAWINTLGFHEITLSSLSSGDHSQIGTIIRALNNRYGGKGISFAFPSLRINSFTLPLLNELSAVRKSGLTFAVETPEPGRQKGLNKEIEREKIVDILLAAKKLGWRVAKFYFMIGLPVSDPGTETASIIDFIRTIQEKSGLDINVNLATFIPKPHTPFQWAEQLTPDEAFKRLHTVKSNLKGKRFKVSYHSPFLSFLEGIISRGDERVGMLAEEAYKNGAVFDSWEEYLNKQAWEQGLDSCDGEIASESLRDRDTEERLPWDTVDIGVTKSFLKREYWKSLNQERTTPCSDACDHNCGVCRDDVEVKRATIDTGEKPEKYFSKHDSADRRKILFSFKKEGKAIFLSHLDLMTVLGRSFRRAGLRMRLTEGFNPKPKMEFAHPLSLGIASDEEIASIVLENSTVSGKTPEIKYTDMIREKFNNGLPAGLHVTSCMEIPFIANKRTGKKTRSLMSLYGGADYTISLYKDTGTVRNEITNVITLEALRDWITNSDWGRDCTIPTDKIDNIDNIDGEYLMVRIYNSGKKTANILHVVKMFLQECGCRPENPEKSENPFVYFSIKRRKVYTNREAPSLSQISQKEKQTAQHHRENAQKFAQNSVQINAQKSASAFLEDENDENGPYMRGLVTYFDYFRFLDSSQ